MATNNTQCNTDDLGSIYPGLILAGHYILLKQIGHGNNAHVWMVYHIVTDSYLAMKIQDFECYKDGKREIMIIKKITEYAKFHPNKNIHCIKLLDSFIYKEDDEVQYVCSVYELCQKLCNNFQRYL